MKQDYTKNLDQLEKELQALDIQPMWLGCEYINDPNKMIKTHLSYLRANQDKEKQIDRFKPYYNRLCKMLELSKKK